MGFLDRVLGREKFSQWSIADKAFAGWWLGTDEASEVVNPATVIGLSAVRRSVQILCTIAGLPLKSYERDGDERVRIESVFDNPYPGIDGMTPFAWVETLIIHLALWDKAFLWHEDVAADGTVLTYKPIHPDVIKKVYRDAKGKRKFDYTDDNNETQTVGSEQITFIPGPSHDGTTVPAALYAARAIFSAALSGDRGAQATLRRSIRLGGLVTPGDGENDDFDPEEGEAILESLRSKVVGREHSGDIAIINRRVKLTQWAQNNQDMQWIETRKDVLGDIERYFGMPPHLMADTEKQTSWGTGVAEQNLSLARYTLRGYSDRIEQVLSLRLSEGQFCEFDYAGLLQGTPEQEINLLIAQMDAGILTIDEVRKIRNLPPLTPAQKAEKALQRMPKPVTDEVAA